MVRRDGEVPAMVLTLPGAALAGLWPVTGHLLLAGAGQPAPAMAVLAVTVLAGALVWCLALSSGLGRVSAAVPLTCRAAALRRKAWGAAFLRQRDPDAAGRPRSRAPSVVPAAAACAVA